MKSRRSHHHTPRRKPTSKQLDANNHIPRFDFGVNVDNEENKTATVKELLEELTYENVNKYSGNELDITNLKTVLRFLRTISDKPLKSTIEKHPIVDIKTIKTVYNHNYDCGSQLIGLIEPSCKKPETIIDIILSPQTEGSKVILDIIKRIIFDLEKEMPPEALHEIGKICSPMWHEDMCIQKTNEEIDDVILRHIHIDDNLVKEADKYLSDKTRLFHKSITPLKKEKSLHIATYTYFKLLFHIQWLNFQIKTKLTIHDNSIVSNKQVDFDEICHELSKSQNKEIFKDTPFLSIEQTPRFIDDHAYYIAKLVSGSTGNTYNTRDVLTDKTRVKAVLRLYIDATTLPNDINKKLLGVAHVIAAFCSILHQRKTKHRLGNTSRRYSSTFLSPQNLLDKYSLHEPQDLPVTVRLIYKERTFWYLHALLGRKDKSDSQKAIHFHQSELYRDIYMSLDHVQINNKIFEYRNIMEKSAHEFIVIHNKQDTILEWINEC